MLPCFRQLNLAHLLQSTKPQPQTTTSTLRPPLRHILPSEHCLLPGRGMSAAVGVLKFVLPDCSKSSILQATTTALQQDSC